MRSGFPETRSAGHWIIVRKDRYPLRNWQRIPVLFKSAAVLLGQLLILFIYIFSCQDDLGSAFRAEIILAYTAEGAFKICRKIFPLCGLDPVIGLTLVLVIHIAAYIANILHNYVLLFFGEGQIPEASTAFICFYFTVWGLYPQSMNLLRGQKEAEILEIVLNSRMLSGRIKGIRSGRCARTAGTAGGLPRPVWRTPRDCRCRRRPAGREETGGRENEDLSTGR